MRIIKATNVGHVDAKGTRHAVYSCDIQVKSKRLATGGGDCTVKIWQTDEIIATGANLSTDVLEEEVFDRCHLATLAVHEGSVNVVRWSLDGKYLASGSDDTTILIYKLTNAGATVGSNFGKAGNQIKNKEPWQRCYTLRGHNSDVMDIDWSAKGLLASGSIDNKVLIWSITSQSTTSTIISPIKLLDIHKSYVKGVAFDPLACYLATCGSDNTVNIWDCNSWDVVKSFTEPLKDTKDLTLFRRLTWSPDGQCMCITGATKSKKQIGYVVKRNSWIPYVDLVGHDAPLLSGRFCPEMFIDKNGDQSSPILCIAVGDQKGVLSIWNTRNKMPLVVLRDAVINDITDIAWLVSNQSVSLVYTSLDGSIVFLDFGDELGVPMNEYMVDSHFKTVYGRGKSDMTIEPEVLVEDPLALQYSAMHSGIQLTAPSTLPPPISNTTSMARPVNTLQVKSKTADGKKRITPMLVQPQGVSTDTISAAVPVETMPGMKRPISSTQEPVHTSGGSNANVKVLRIAFNKEDIISSVPISTAKNNDLQCFVKANKFETTQNRIGLTNFTSQLPRYRIKSNRLTKTATTGSAPPNNYLGITAVSNITLYKISPDENGSNGDKANNNKALWFSSVAGDTLALCAIKESSNSKRARSSFSGSMHHGTSIQPEIDSSLEGLCLIGCTDGSLHVLSLATGMLLCPPLILGAPVTHVDVIETFPVVNGPSVFRILALSAYGNMWVWDVVNGQLQIHCKDTIHAALVSMKCRNVTGPKGNIGTDSNIETNIESFGFNEVGVPMLYVKSQGALGGDWQAFVYYKDAAVWARVADLRHIMSRLFNISINSQFQDSDATSITDISMLEGRISRNSGVTVEDILKVAKSRIDTNSGVPNDSATWSNMVTLMHCENRLALAFDLSSGSDNSQGKKWLAEWAYLCCCGGLDNRVAWVSNILLSNISKQRNVNYDESSPPSIGWHWLFTDHQNSLELLRTIILPAIANSKRCTNLFTDINDSINLICNV